MAEWNIVIEKRTVSEKYVTVEAASREEAINLAKGQACLAGDDGGFIEYDWDYEITDVDRVE